MGRHTTEDDYKKELKTLKDVNVQENQHREQKKLEYKKQQVLEKEAIYA